MRVILALLLLGVAGCATPAGSGSAGGTSASASPSADDVVLADNDLLLVLDRGNGTEPERYTLSCIGVPEGDHPDPAAACAHLEGLDDPFAPLPADAVCTEQYGGPETVRITGRWHGEPVEAELSRTDGCRISQWESLGPVLPPVEGAVAE
jgi:Subtilisin inhibitor-like